MKNKMEELENQLNFLVDKLQVADVKTSNNATPLVLLPMSTHSAKIWVCGNSITKTLRTPLSGITIGDNGESAVFSYSGETIKEIQDEIPNLNRVLNLLFSW